jgi:hypothetical protein
MSNSSPERNRAIVLEAFESIYSDPSANWKLPAMSLNL